MKPNPFFRWLACPALFCLLSAVPLAFAGDIVFYGILKQKSFEQTTNTAPTLPATGGFGFQCFVVSSESGLISDATLGISGGGSRTLTADGSDEFSFHQTFDSASAMNAVYKTGTYNLTVNSENDFTSFAQLTMPADNYPGAPFLSNFNAAQTINPSNSFTLNWSGFTGGTTSDYIEVQIEDINGNNIHQSSQGPGSPGALNGTSTSYEIPANALSPGETYQARLMFAKIVTSDSTSIPGAQGLLAFLSETTLNLKTTGTPPTIQLQVIGMLDGKFEFKFNSIPGKNYQLQFANNLPDWQDLSFTNASSTETAFSDEFAGGNEKRFYRVQRVP